jgi:hypothetical protein
MRSFMDNAGNTWEVAVNINSVKRCRALLNIDLYTLIDDKFAGLGKLLSDPPALVDVLYVLCKEESDRKAITDADFGKAMWGDCLNKGQEAFIEALIDFFPDPRVRDALRKVMDAGRKMQAKAMDLFMNKMESDIDVDAQAKSLILSLMSARASSESTLDHTRSENSPLGPKPEASSHGRKRRRSSV